jgi:hypothetical protein
MRRLSSSRRRVVSDSFEVGGLVEPLHDYALASDVRLHFGDVPISLGKMLLQLSAVHRSKGSTAKAKTPSGEEAGGVLTLGTRKD